MRRENYKSVLTSDSYNLDITIQGLAWMYWDSNPATPWKMWFPNATDHELSIVINGGTPIPIPYGSELNLNHTHPDNSPSAQSTDFSTKVLNVNRYYEKVKFNSQVLSNSVYFPMENAKVYPSSIEFLGEVLEYNPDRLGTKKRWVEENVFAPFVEAGVNNLEDGETTITVTPELLTNPNPIATLNYRNGKKNKILITNHCEKAGGCDFDSDFHFYHDLMKLDDLTTKTRYAVLANVAYGEHRVITDSADAPCNVIYSQPDSPPN